MRDCTMRVLGLFISLVISAGQSFGQQQSSQGPPHYRVIFNCDGYSTFKDAQGNMGHWLENLFKPLENSHVDAIFWCDGAGGNTAN